MTLKPVSVFTDSIPRYAMTYSSCKVAQSGAKIVRIAQIAVYHCGTVYKLEVNYVLDNGQILSCAHGDPTMEDLVRDVISISGTCIYQQ
jgi:hypothetical protein